MGSTSPTDHGPTTIETIDMGVHLTDLPTYYHQYDLTFTPAADGMVTFTGVGKQFDNGGETITGSIDTTNHTVTWLSHVPEHGRHGSTVPDNTWGVTKAPYTVNPNGDLDWTGISDQGQNGYALTGGFRNVPAAPVAPVAGNHGEYVAAMAAAASSAELRRHADGHQVGDKSSNLRTNQQPVPLRRGGLWPSVAAQRSRPPRPSAPGMRSRGR